jgi:hypothetical protein
MSLLALWLSILPRLQSQPMDEPLPPDRGPLPSTNQLSRKIGQNPGVAIGVAVAAGVAMGCLFKR